MEKKILGIETSCDDTSAAVISGNNSGAKIVSSVVSSQINIHKKYGGVVPEVASRSHLEAIIPVARQALKKAKINISEIDAICTTVGPGLSGSLVVGTTFAKTAAWLADKPVFAINHIEGHIYANFSEKKKIKFPAIVLIVSGGHTQIVLMRDYFDYKVLGETKDDAAGEAFDKVARILNLPYPGGPSIEKAAIGGNEDAFIFPQSGIEEKTIRLDSGYLAKVQPDLNFSFSGVKTSVINVARQTKLTKKKVADICASFQKAIVEVLSKKVMWAAKRWGAKSILLCGGVSANKSLRQKISELSEEEKLSFFVPDVSLSTDNAAMIAIAGLFRLMSKKENKKIIINPNLRIGPKQS